MKKTILMLVVCILMSSLVLAQGAGDMQGSGQQIQTTTVTQQQNQGEETQIQTQVQTQSRVHAGSYTSENGQQLQIQEQANNRLQIKVGNASAQTSMNITQAQVQERTRLEVKLSNGKGAEIKIMPNTASETAMQRLRLKVCSAENNCQIELKEVGSGEQVRAAYQVQAQKETKVLGLFRARMQVQAQIDAENGEVIRTKMPWWAFLATE